VAAGARLSTHLGNGAHGQLPRHPNYIWEQLAEDGLCASIIVDGFHLPPAVVKTMYRTKGSERLILVSDVVSAAGLPPGIHQFMGLDVEVREDGSVRVPGSPYLAGSSLKLGDAIGKFIQFSGASFREAVTMATENPARLVGSGGRHGFLQVGGTANLAIFGSAPQYELSYVIAAGEVCYSA
jgi:N-acetylglucosamine-6-phosphate deacetylase